MILNGKKYYFYLKMDSVKNLCIYKKSPPSLQILTEKVKGIGYKMMKFISLLI